MVCEERDVKSLVVEEKGPPRKKITFYNVFKVNKNLKNDSTHMGCF